MKVSIEFAVLMYKGKEFQAFAAATMKLWSPMARLDLGTTKRFVSMADRRERAGTYTVNSSAMYGGAKLLKALNTYSNTLKMILC